MKKNLKNAAQHTRKENLNGRCFIYSFRSSETNKNKF